MNIAEPYDDTNFARLVAARPNDGWIQAYPFSLRSPQSGNLRHEERLGCIMRLHGRGDVMRKILVALVAAATIAGAAVTTSGPAEARWGGGWHGGGWHGGGWRGGWGWGAGGFVAGALVGSALAAPYYYGYGYPYGYYPYPYYGRPCVWRRWWNGYTWVRGCV